MPCNDALGLGIPHHVQSFFARIRDFATLRGTRTVTRHGRAARLTSTS